MLLSIRKGNHHDPDHNDDHHQDDPDDHPGNDQDGKTPPNVIPIRAISKSRHGGGERIHSPDKTYSFLSKKYMWRMITKREHVIKIMMKIS